MSALAIFDTQRNLSADLKLRIAQAAGIDLENYVATIVDQLNRRGLYELRDEMLNEIEEYRTQQANREHRRRVARGLE